MYRIGTKPGFLSDLGSIKAQTLIVASYVTSDLMVSNYSMADISSTAYHIVACFCAKGPKP